MVDLLVEIVLKPGSVATEEHWREICTEALKPLTVTAKFSVVSEIPRTGSGKVMRH